MPFIPAEDEFRTDCPHCGGAVTVPRLAVLDLAIDRHARDRVQRGHVVVASCPGCDHGIEPGGALLVLHSDQRWAVARLPRAATAGTEADALRVHLDALRDDGFTVRTVRDTRELLEKSRVLDHGLDDRVLEYLKAKLVHREPDGAHASFVSLDDDEDGRPCLLLAVTQANDIAASSYHSIGRAEHDAAIDDVHAAVASRREPADVTRVGSGYGRELARILDEYHRRTEW